MNTKKGQGFLRTLGVLLFFVLFFAFVRGYSAEQKYWVIQVASYEDRDRGASDLERLTLRQFPNVRLEKVDQSAYPYKLLIGRFATKEEGSAILKRAQSLFPEAFQRSFTVSASVSSPRPAEKPLQAIQASASLAPAKKTEKKQKTDKLLHEPFKPALLTSGPPPKPSPVEERVKVNLRTNPTEIEETISEELPVAESDTIVPFEAMGYPEETYLPGSSPEFVFHVLKPKGLIRAEAEMVMRFSSVLSEKSVLTVEVDHIPQFTKNLKEIGYTPRLSFPIPLTSSEHIKVLVKGHLFITEDACASQTTGETWMVISNKSRLILSGHHPEPTQISDFFRNYNRNMAVVLDPKTVSLSALPLFYYLYPINDWKKINVLLTDQPQADQSTIRVGRFSQDIDVRDGELRVYEEKVHLLKKTLQPLYITSAVRDAELVEEDRTKGILRFEDMGLPHFNATGVGDLSMSVPLHYSLFSGIPNNLKLTLMASHTPIPSGDKAFLRIFVNKLLLKAIQLEKGGLPRAYRVDIPSELLPVYNNTLEVVASYFPSQGRCGGSDPRMTFSVSNASRFEYDSVTRHGIESVVDVMGSLSGKVLLMVDDRAMFLPGVHLMNLLGQFNKEIRHIVVQTWSGTIPEGYDFVVLLLKPENTQGLDLPLKLDKGRFAIVNPVTNVNLFAKGREAVKQNVASLHYQDEFGVLQTFNARGSKALLLSYYKDPRAMEFLKEITIHDVGRFNGNVVLFNQNIVSYHVGDKFRVTYQEARSLPMYLNRFKLPLVLLGVLILLIFLFHVNKKLVREP